MKKLSIIAVLVAVGLVGGFAYAKSMCVPWFVDNAANASSYPPTAGVAAIIYLHNNLATPKECNITYYNQDGVEQALPAGGNTFTVPALSTVAFRPVADDPVSAGGQESVLAQTIPNRPMAAPADGKKNGAIVIGWQGDATDIQGILGQAQAVAATGAYAGKIAGPGLLVSYATLLPGGA